MLYIIKDKNILIKILEKILFLTEWNKPNNAFWLRAIEYLLIWIIRITEISINNFETNIKNNLENKKLNNKESHKK